MSSVHRHWVSLISALPRGWSKTFCHRTCRHALAVERRPCRDRLPPVRRAAVLSRMHRAGKLLAPGAAGCARHSTGLLTSVAQGCKARGVALSSCLRTSPQPRIASSGLSLRSNMRPSRAVTCCSSTSRQAGSSAAWMFSIIARFRRRKIEHARSCASGALAHWLPVALRLPSLSR
jgi:hypothetical protein